MAQEVLQVKLTLDGKEYELGMKQAEQRTRSFMDGFEAVGERLTLFATTTLALVATQGLKTAMSLEESLNRVEVSFGKSAEGIKDFAKTTVDSFGISQGAALSMAGTFGDMATSMGINQTEAAKMSTSLVGLAGDLASFKDIPISEAVTALTSIFTGETESLKMLGVVMTEVNLKAFALQKGITKKYETMTEAERVLLRYNFVLEKTRNAQGDYARTSDSASNATRTMQERFKEVTGDLMNQVLPIYTQLVLKVNDILKSVSELSPEMKQLIVIIGGIVGIAGPVMLAISGITAAVGTLGATFATALGWVGIIGAALASIYVFRNEILKVLKEIELGFIKFNLRIYENLAKLPSALLGDSFRKGLDIVKKDLKDAEMDLFRLSIKGSQSGFMAQELGYTGLGGKPAIGTTGIASIGGGTQGDGVNKDAGTIQFGQRFLKGIQKMKDDVEIAYFDALKFVQNFKDSKLQGLTLEGFFVRQLLSGGTEVQFVGDGLPTTFQKVEDNIIKGMEGRIQNIQNGIRNFSHKTISAYRQSIYDLTEAMEKELSKSVEQVFELGLESAALSIEGIFTQIFGGEFDWKQAAAGMLNGLASIMQELGKHMITLGMAKEAFKVALKDMFGGGVGLIVAGGALIAGAAAIRGYSNSISQRSTASSAGSGGSNFTAPTFNVQGSLVAKGTDLVAVINNTKKLYGA